MNPANHRSRPSSAEPSDDDLRRILEASERRRKAEQGRNSRIFSAILIIPTVAVVAWVAWFFVRYQANEEPVAIKPVKSLPAAVDDSKVISELDNFRPKAMRAGSSTPPAQILQEGGKLVDEEDIRFVMQLMNFSQVPAPKEKKGK